MLRVMLLTLLPSVQVNVVKEDQVDSSEVDGGAASHNDDLATINAMKTVFIFGFFNRVRSGTDCIFWGFVIFAQDAA